MFYVKWEKSIDDNNLWAIYLTQSILLDISSLFEIEYLN